MSDYEFWDDDVEKVQNQAGDGNPEIYEVTFKGPVPVFHIHKDDVIHLAGWFGLAVYEKDSAL